jgi:hypothetical protein
LGGFASKGVDLLGFGLEKVKSFMIWSTIALSLSSMVMKVMMVMRELKCREVHVVGCVEKLKERLQMRRGKRCEHIDVGGQLFHALGIKSSWIDLEQSMSSCTICVWSSDLNPSPHSAHPDTGQCARKAVWVNCQPISFSRYILIY